LGDLPVSITQPKGDGYLFQRRVVAALIARGWLGLADLDGLNVGPAIDRFLGVTDYDPFFLHPEVCICETEMANHGKQGNRFCGQVIIQPAKNASGQPLGSILEVEDFFNSIGVRGSEAFLRVLDCASGVRIWSSAELFGFATMNWWGGEETDEGALRYLVEDCGEPEDEFDLTRRPSLIRERLRLPDNSQSYKELAIEALANWFLVDEKEAVLHNKLTGLLVKFNTEEDAASAANSRFKPEFIEDEDFEREPLLVLNFANDLGQQIFDDFERYANGSNGTTDMIAGYKFNGAMEFASALEFMRGFVSEIRMVDECLRALSECQKQPVASLDA
jgi:hypothetical protein